MKNDNCRVCVWAAGGRGALKNMGFVQDFKSRECSNVSDQLDSGDSAVGERCG